MSYMYISAGASQLQPDMTQQFGLHVGAQQSEQLGSQHSQWQPQQQFELVYLLKLIHFITNFNHLHYLNIHNTNTESTNHMVEVISIIFRTWMVKYYRLLICNSRHYFSSNITLICIKYPLDEILFRAGPYIHRNRCQPQQQCHILFQ